MNEKESLFQGLLNLREIWYYFRKGKNNPAGSQTGPEGSMLIGSYAISGKTYIFNANGVCTNP
jgi:hypothetical protein